MLGRQQIASVSTAISEVFKNAHDAYAHQVRADLIVEPRCLLIRDDGIGMTESEFLNNWLTLATRMSRVPWIFGGGPVMLMQLRAHLRMGM